MPATLDTTTFNTNNDSIRTALATIATAYNANKALLAGAIVNRAAEQGVLGHNAPGAGAGMLVSRYAEDVARAAMTAGLREIMVAAHEGGVTVTSDLRCQGGSTNLTTAWSTLVASGNLGPHS